MRLGWTAFARLRLKLKYKDIAMCLKKNVFELCIFMKLQNADQDTN